MALAKTTDAIGAAAMNKAFWRILPLIGLAYLFAYMDRVNVGFAAVNRRPKGTPYRRPKGTPL